MNFDARVNNQIKRNDFSMIIAANRQLASLVPVRLAYTASDRKAGLVLGRITASGYYSEYNDANSDGTQTAVGVLADDVLVEDVTTTSPSGAASGTALARMFTGGELYYDKLTGIDAAGITDLKARKIITADSVSVLKF